jgi:hypothetical protein
MGRGESHSPLSYIKGSENGLHYCKYVGTERFQGRDVEVIVTGIKPDAGRQVTIRWLLDLSRGALPLRVSFVNADGSARGEVDVKSIRKLANGVFLPEESLTMWQNGETVGVTSIRLISIDTSIPDLNALSMAVPEGYEVVDIADMRSVIKTTGPETICAANLEQWIQRCHARRNNRLENGVELK